MVWQGSCKIVNMFRRSWSCGWVAAVAGHVAVHVGQVARAQVNLAVAVAVVAIIVAVVVAIIVAIAVAVVVAVVVVDVATRLLGQGQVQGGGGGHLMDEANVIEYYLWSVEYLVCSNLSFSRERTSFLIMMGSVFSFCFLPDTKLHSLEQRQL